MRSARDMINAISFTCKPLAVDSAYYPRLSALETGLQRLCPLASAWRMDALLGALLSQQVRAKAGMRTKPSVVIIDFQSVKTTQKGQRGYGAGKKIKGRGGCCWPQWCTRLAFRTGVGAIVEKGLCLAESIETTGQERRGHRPLQPKHP